MQPREPPTKLALLNAHERDPYITFDEGPHIYTVKGDSSFTSVTTWLGSHFSHFDADAVIDKMMKKINNDPSYKYYGNMVDITFSTRSSTEPDNSIKFLIL